jgi:hypothetical protein
MLAARIHGGLAPVQSNYKKLVYPDVPDGWKFCAHCGNKMEWRSHRWVTYNRATGQRDARWHYECPAYAGGGPHDHLDDGDQVIEYVWAAS